MIDWDRVIRLRNEIGADEFEPVLEVFIDEVEHLVMQLDLDDPARLTRYLHFLKGSACNLGFVDFGARCAQIEVRVSADDLAGVSLDDLVECYSLTKRVFNRDLMHRTGHGRQAGRAEIA